MRASEYLTNYQSVVNTDPEKTLTFDWETYWDSKTFTLKKMSMEEYIRDPRFKAHGVGIQLGSKPAHWVYGEESIVKFFDTVPLDNMTVVGQNVAFDGLILNDIYGVHPKSYIDTWSMSTMAYGNVLAKNSLAALTKMFLPGMVKDRTALYNTDGIRDLTPEMAEELGEYCKMDCYLTHELYKFFLPKLLATPFNMDLIDHVTRMYTNPVLELDHDVLNDLLAREIVEKQAAVDSCVATSAKQLNSNKQFATLLESQGATVPMKPSPSNPTKNTYAFAKTDRAFTDMSKDTNPEVAALVTARLRVKTNINETRASNYLGVESRGKWPVHLNISGARTTHRLSGGAGGGGNPQNLGNGSPLRYAIKPPKGFRMFAIDSKGIELRDAMTLANEREVVKRLHDPTFDLYSVFGTEIYNCELAQIDKPRRDVGKVACLQLQYGSGGPTFKDVAWNRGVDLELEEAERIKGLYRSTFTNITRTWRVCDRVIQMLVGGEEEETWFSHLVRPVANGPGGHHALLLVETGTYITYPNLKREYDPEQKRWQYMYDTFDNKTYRLVRTGLWGSKMFGHICQSLARNVVLEQEVALDTFLKNEIHHTCTTAMSVHDEGVCLVPDHADHDKAMAGALEIFSTSPVWWPELPVYGEAGWGDNYGQAK